MSKGEGWHGIVKVGTWRSDWVELNWFALYQVTLVCSACVWGMPLEKAEILCPECAQRFGITW